MKKIISVKLLKDLPGCEKDTSASPSSNGTYSFYGCSDIRFHFTTEHIMINPDWFKVCYEDEKSEVWIKSGWKEEKTWGGSGTLTEHNADELARHLIKCMSEYRKSRCSKCGGPLMCSSSGIECDKDRKNNIFHNCELDDLVPRNCTYYKPKCRSCNNVEDK